MPIQNTSNNDQVFDNTESLPTAHQNYRTIAQSHVTTYVEQIKVTMQKFQKGSKSIKKGDLVFLHIPNADKNKFDRTKLACKVIQVHENGLCQLGCFSGIISVQYSTANLETIQPGIHYTELDDIPNRYVTLHKAASAQSLVNLTKIRCSCKTSCSTAQWACRKAAVICNLNCSNVN